jgi:hypothetical protein
MRDAALAFLAEGHYEGAKALAHGIAGLLLFTFALYSGAAWWHRLTVARAAGVEDPSFTHLAAGLVGYMALASFEVVVALQHWESW